MWYCTGDGQVPTSAFGGNFESYLCRGVDRYGHNPVPVGRPAADGVPTRSGGGHSSEYECRAPASGYG